MKNLLNYIYSDEFGLVKVMRKVVLLTRIIIKNIGEDKIKELSKQLTNLEYNSYKDLANIIIVELEEDDNKELKEDLIGDDFTLPEDVITIYCYDTYVYRAVCLCANNIKELYKQYYPHINPILSISINKVIFEDRFTRLTQKDKKDLTTSDKLFKQLMENFDEDDNLI